MSGDLEGKICATQYKTGETMGVVGQHSDSVESICFNQNSGFPIAVSAGIDTSIFVYDLAKMEIRTKITPNDYGGYTKV